MSVYDSKSQRSKRKTYKKYALKKLVAPMRKVKHLDPAAAHNMTGGFTWRTYTTKSGRKVRRREARRGGRA